MIVDITNVDVLPQEIHNEMHSLVVSVSSDNLHFFLRSHNCQNKTFSQINISRISKESSTTGLTRIKFCRVSC